MAKADSSSVRQSTLSVSESLSASGSTRRLLVVTDSSDHRYPAEIIPFGAFHYSPEEGFTGTASRVMIKGRVKGLLSVRDSAGAAWVMSAVTQKDSVGREKRETKKDTVSRTVRKGSVMGA